MEGRFLFFWVFWGGFVMLTSWYWYFQPSTGQPKNWGIYRRNPACLRHTEHNSTHKGWDCGQGQTAWVVVCCMRDRVWTLPNICPSLLFGSASRRQIRRCSGWCLRQVWKSEKRSCFPCGSGAGAVVRWWLFSGCLWLSLFTSITLRVTIL